MNTKKIMSIFFALTIVSQINVYATNEVIKVASEEKENKEEGEKNQEKKQVGRALFRSQMRTAKVGHSAFGAALGILLTAGAIFLAGRFSDFSSVKLYDVCVLVPGFNVFSFLRIGTVSKNISFFQKNKESFYYRTYYDEIFDFKNLQSKLSGRNFYSDNDAVLPKSEIETIANKIDDLQKNNKIKEIVIVFNVFNNTLTSALKNENKDKVLTFGGFCILGSNIRCINFLFSDTFKQKVKLPIKFVINFVEKIPVRFPEAECKAPESFDAFFTLPSGYGDKLQHNSNVDRIFSNPGNYNLSFDYKIKDFKKNLNDNLTSVLDTIEHQNYKSLKEDINNNRITFLTFKEYFGDNVEPLITLDDYKSNFGIAF